MDDDYSIESRQRVFVRKARSSAGQALYYLKHLDDVLRSRWFDEAKRRYYAFALAQVKALVYGVHIAHDYLPARAPDGSFRSANDSAPVEVRVWHDVVRLELDQLDGARGPTTSGTSRVEVAKLMAAFTLFLRESRGSRDSWRHLATHSERWIRRRLTTILAVAVSGVLLRGVEALNSLLLNQGPTALAVAGLALLPVALHYLLAQRWRLSWGVHAFRPTAVIEPERTLLRWPPRCPFTYFSVRSFGRDFAVLAGSAGLIALGLAAAGQIRGGTSYLTVFLILSLLILFVRFCRFLDRWDFIDARPIRLAALGIGGLFLLLTLYEHFCPLAIAILVVGGMLLFFTWRDRAPWQLLTAIGLVTGLGIWSAARAGHLNDANTWREDSASPGTVRIDPVEFPFPGDTGPVVLVAASGGGSRAAIYTAKVLTRLHQELPDVASRINAISSVSGGSLATAAYVARRYAQAPLDDLEAGMGQDFLLPTLLGALVPWRSRGRALEEYWDEPAPGQPSLRGLTVADLSNGWKRKLQAGDRLPPFPLPLFNACTLDSHTVVISPLPRALYTKATGDTWRKLREWYGILPEDQPTWVVDRDGIYGLEDLLHNSNPELRRAVRASANFPFGFPLVSLATFEDRLILSPTLRSGSPLKTAGHEPVTVELTDGGVLSNSGLWSLFQLMTDQTPLDPRAAPGTPNTVLDKLRARGVLLIVIEASRMPEYSRNRRSLLTLYGAIGDKNPIAQNLHRRMFELLRDRYQSRVAIVQLDLIPQQRVESFNVHTTWALDGRSKDKLQRSFGRVWKAAQPTIDEKFKLLRSHKDPGPDLVLRPPLD